MCQAIHRTKNGNWFEGHAQAEGRIESRDLYNATRRLHIVTEIPVRVERVQRLSHTFTYRIIVCSEVKSTLLLESHPPADPRGRKAPSAFF